MKSILWTLLVGICVVVGTTQTQAAISICDNTPRNQVTNCGFETGDFTGWTLTGFDVPGELNNFYGVEGTDPFDGISPNSGGWQAYFADVVGNDTTISQTISTFAGTEYYISFYLAQDTPPTSAPKPGGGVSGTALTSSPRRSEVQRC